MSSAAKRRTATLEASSLNGTRGFLIQENTNTNIGFGSVSIAEVGDVNGDGIDDLFFSARESVPGNIIGTSYVVFGHKGASPATVPIAGLDDAHALKFVNFSNGGVDSHLAPVGDVNGDGLADLIVGTPQTGSIPGANVGAAVVFGSPVHTTVDIITPHLAKYVDVDGDRVTVTVSKGTLAQENFSAFFRGKGKQLGALHLDGADFSGAVVTVEATRGKNGGDGRAAVGAIESNVDLRAASVDGNLGRIEVGDTVASTPALGTLTVQSIGAFGLQTQEPADANLVSKIHGAIGALRVAHSVRDASFLIGDFTAGIGACGFLKTGGGLTNSNISVAGSLTTAQIGGSVTRSYIMVGTDGLVRGAARFATLDSLTVGGDFDHSSVAVGGRLGTMSVGETLDSADYGPHQCRSNSRRKAHKTTMKITFLTRIFILLASVCGQAAEPTETPALDFSKSGRIGSVRSDAKETGGGKFTSSNWESGWGSYDRDITQNKTVATSITNIGRTNTEVRFDLYWISRKLSDGSFEIFGWDNGTKDYKTMEVMPFTSYMLPMQSNVANYATLREKWVVGTKLAGWIAIASNKGVVLSHKASTATIEGMVRTTLPNLIREYHRQVALRKE